MPGYFLDTSALAKHYHLETLRQLLGQCPAPLTRQEILDRWPEANQPRADLPWRALARGCELGVLVRTAAGTRRRRSGMAGAARAWGLMLAGNEELGTM
jgi:hypothetical protein